MFFPFLLLQYIWLQRIHSSKQLQWDLKETLLPLQSMWQLQRIHSSEQLPTGFWPCLKLVSTNQTRPTASVRSLLEALEHQWRV